MTSSNSQNNSALKSVGIGLGILAVIAVCVYGLMRLGASSNPTGVTGGDIPSVSASDWTRGNLYAKNILVEYSDLQCPACGAYEPLIRQLMKDFDNQILLVYRHFPLSQHIHAELASQAAEAAGKQGQFWEMHDLLFDRQGSWENAKDAEATFKGYAKELGLDEAKFAADLNSDEIKKLVDEDANGGLHAGVNSTPTFYLNGKKITNPKTYEEFKTLIQSGS